MSGYKQLYGSKIFHFSEHDTSAGGSDDTQKNLNIFEVICIPSIYFVLRNKVYKYFGPWDKDTIEHLYERLGNIALLTKHNIAPCRPSALVYLFFFTPDGFSDDRKEKLLKD